MKGYQIPQNVKRYVGHDMIQAHTELPSFPNERVALLYAFLNRNNDNCQVTERMASVTLLVQLGLDTHDTVEYASASTSDRNMRSRQLKVLAGDYFSSRFYQMLAQSGQIDAIQMLSRAVCDVNRLKMYAAAKMLDGSMTHEYYYEYAVKMKQCLFHAFNEWIASTDIELYDQLLDLITEREVLREEQKIVQRRAIEAQSWTYWLVLEHAASAQRNRWLTESIDQLEWDKLVDQLNPEAMIQQRLQSVEDRLSMIVGSMAREIQLSFAGTIVSELAI